MAIAINGSDGNPFTTRDVDGTAANFVFSQHKLTFSGSYSTGGDTLNLSGIASLIPSGSLPLQVFVEGNGTGTNQSAAGGYYVVLTGTTLANWLIKIFSGGGTELAAGAYPAAVTADIVTMQICWRKLL